MSDEVIMFDEIIRSSVVVLFALGQIAIVALASTAFKIYLDVRDLKKSMNFAFTKIRKLEELTK